MSFLDIKEGLKKENRAEFLKKNMRYLIACGLFVILIVVLIVWAVKKKDVSDETVSSTEITESTEEGYQVDAVPEVNALINQYYTAYAAGDVATITSIATPVSTNEQSYITSFSQLVEAYQNIVCYTKPGLDTNSYMVFVGLEMKFANVETTAPGLDFFYVRTNENGVLYIDNLYSLYNREYQENSQDISVSKMILDYQSSAEVIALQQDTQTRYNVAVESDTALADMINTTIPTVMNDWVNATVAAQTAEETPTEETPTEEAPVEETPTEEAPAEETPAEEAPAEEAPQTESVQTTDKVNVRAGAGTDTEKLGTVASGTVLTRSGTEGDWSIVDYNGTPGYILSEYLTTEISESTEGAADPNGIVAGTVVQLQDTVNIRSGMSDTAERVGLAYAGEQVTVVMSYAEGWTKVTWKNETGYIKTSLLQ